MARGVVCPAGGVGLGGGVGSGVGTRGTSLAWNRNRIQFKTRTDRLEFV